MKSALVALLACAAAGNAVWQTPVNLGTPVNTADMEVFPTVPADGSYMIFASNRVGGLGALDLWRSYYTGGAWQSPVNLGSNVNGSSTETRPFLAVDDTLLYFASNESGYGGFDIFYCTITSDGVVGAKDNLGSAINTVDEEASPVLSPDGNTLYFTSNRVSGGYGATDVWVSEKSGNNWGTPLNLGGVINTANAEEPAWISDDGNTLVFTSDRPGTYGAMDLWYSLKSGGVWQTPVNFGPTINSTYSEYGCSLYCNHGGLGGVIYFSSARAGGEGSFDVWTSTDDEYISVTPTSFGTVKAGFR